QIGDRPSLGAWLTYGLGSASRDLPGFVVLLHGETGRQAAWSSGFLPARYQGTLTSAAGAPNLKLPADASRDERRLQLELLSQLNEHHRRGRPADSELEARIASYELAFRMQSAAPEVFDLSGETQETKKLYGLHEKETESMGTLCLLARR